ncbi:MAG: carbohydrate ABC transporter permease [Clostridiales bacterium]|jgi:putative aldouronate transport system permease protein|nr:carbohydrate ABC transporter permease [Clostridiales bacterium]MDR2750193.1 carbohydrate ABC transporter permease [Clostridiales bacterium]
MQGITKRKGARLNSVSLPASVAINTILGAFALCCIIPFIFVVIISFTDKESIIANGYSFFPSAWSLAAYDVAIKLGRQLWLSYFNSFLITVIGTVFSVLICILYSYGLYRTDYKYRTFFAFFSFFTMMFGGGLAPTVMVCRNLLGMNNNYWALIGPLLVSPFNFIVMRTFFKSSVPEEIIESSSIDGSGEYRTLFQIVMPIAKPGIATIALMNALSYWNEWYLSLLYLSDSKFYPLQYLLMMMQRNIEFIIKNSSVLGKDAIDLAANMPSASLRMALCVFIVVPIAFAYPFFQRYIVAGLTVGSVKG